MAYFYYDNTEQVCITVNDKTISSIIRSLQEQNVTLKTISKVKEALTKIKDLKLEDIPGYVEEIYLDDDQIETLYEDNILSKKETDLESLYQDTVKKHTKNLDSIVADLDRYIYGITNKTFTKQDLIKLRETLTNYSSNLQRDIDG